jgi:hypothetical protein
MPGACAYRLFALAAGAMHHLSLCRLSTGALALPVTAVAIAGDADEKQIFLRRQGSTNSAQGMAAGRQRSGQPCSWKGWDTLVKCVFGLEQC